MASSIFRFLSSTRAPVGHRFFRSAIQASKTSGESRTSVVPWIGIDFLCILSQPFKTPGSRVYVDPFKLGSASQSGFFCLFSHPSGYIRCRSIMCISRVLGDAVKLQPSNVHLLFPGWYQAAEVWSSIVDCELCLFCDPNALRRAEGGSAGPFPQGVVVGAVGKSI